MVSHSLIYLASRVVPGLLGFLAIALFSRLLDASQYGVYALAVASAQLVNAVAFQWIRVGLSRFVPANERPAALLSSLHAAFWWIAGAVAVAAPLGLTFAPPTLVVVSLILAVGLGWHELTLEMLRAKFRPRAYALTTIARALLALSIGALLAAGGFGGLGAAAGAALGAVIPTLVAAGRQWPRPEIRAWNDLGTVLRYGVPLTGAFALGFVIHASDRFLLASMIGDAAVGQYAAGYDLARQSIFLLLMGVSLASFPLAVKALDASGSDAARTELRKSLILIYLLGVPASVGIAVLAPNIAHTLLGADFQDTARRLLPWVGAAAFLSAVREFHANRSFQLAEDTRGLLLPTGLAAFANVALNLAWIPAFGVIGAAYATFAAYAVSLVLTWGLGHRRFPLPFAARGLAGICACAGGMALVLAGVEGWRGPLGLLAQVAIGVVTYGALVLAFDAGGARALLRQVLARDSSSYRERYP